MDYAELASLTVALISAICAVIVVVRSRQVPSGESALRAEMARLIQHVDDINTNGTASLSDVRERLSRIEMTSNEFREHGSPALTPRLAKLEAQMDLMANGVLKGVTDDLGHQHRISLLEGGGISILERLRSLEYQLGNLRYEPSTGEVLTRPIPRGQGQE